MPKTIKPLTVKEVDSLPIGIHAVGGVTGLYIRKSEHVNQFFFRWKVKGQSQKVFMAGGITLKEARERASEYRKQIDIGLNPKEVIQQEAEKKKLEKEEQERIKRERLETFEEAYRRFTQHQKDGNKWANNPIGAKKQDQRAQKYLLPKLGEKRLKDIKPEDVEEILRPLYEKYRSTAQPVKTILNQLFDWANAKGFGRLAGYTPMTSATYLLKDAKKNRRRKQHHPALPFNEVPQFIKCVTAYDSTSAKVAIFAILTCTRSKPARNVRWDSLDLDKGIYTLRLEDDKVKEHYDPLKRRIFLAKPVIAWLRKLPRTGPYVFPSQVTWKPLDVNAIAQFIKKLHKAKKSRDGIGWVDPNIKDDNGNPKKITLHGTARASYRTWCADCKGGKHKPFNERAIEFNLLHEAMGEVEKSYNRAPLESERREIMEAWVKHCLSEVKEL